MKNRLYVQPIAIPENCLMETIATHTNQNYSARVSMSSANPLLCQKPGELKDSNPKRHEKRLGCDCSK